MSRSKLAALQSIEPVIGRLLHLNPKQDTGSKQY